MLKGCLFNVYFMFPNDLSCHSTRRCNIPKIHNKIDDFIEFHIVFSF